MDLLEKMTNIQSSIFDYEVKNISGNVVNIFTEIIESRRIDTSNPQVMMSLNTLMSRCLTAMQSSDYLLLADLMEYELKPMLGGDK